MVIEKVKEVTAIKNQYEKEQKNKTKKTALSKNVPGLNQPMIMDPRQLVCIFP